MTRRAWNRRVRARTGEEMVELDGIRERAGKRSGKQRSGKQGRRGKHCLAQEKKR